MITVGDVLISILTMEIAHSAQLAHTIAQRGSGNNRGANAEKKRTPLQQRSGVEETELMIGKKGRLLENCSAVWNSAPWMRNWVMRSFRPSGT
ncbi:hypothetical protein [Tumebacillus lipolyticus]|uniref:Uncharacterized protein n=1 Tax=Tumebacillus lipolyticus TaxID=1280370 RepID=A0ABW5A2P2_9BACL